MTNQQSPSKYFNNYTYSPTQALFESLVEEAIKIYGFWIYYLPRTRLNNDALFGEDTAAIFKNAVQIESWTKTNEGFDGQRFLSNIGIQIQDQMVLTISQRRFNEIRTECLLSEWGDNIQQEITNRLMPKQVNDIQLEEGGIEGYFIPYERPHEGDLIWIPTFNKIFEISYSQYDNIFFQGGNLPTFDLYCNLFNYSSEEFKTNHSDIDNIGDIFNGDILSDVLETSSNNAIGMEQTDGNLLEEVDLPDNVDSQANNQLLNTEVNDVVDFSEKSPFVKQNTQMKW